MKKFLLPLAGLLLCGSAMAEEVTVKYYPFAMSYSYNGLGAQELFVPTTHEVVQDADNKYTLKHFLNAKGVDGAYKDVSFTIDPAAGTITLVDIAENVSTPFNIAGQYSTYKYYVDLTSAIDGTKWDFPAMIYNMPSYKATPAGVEVLGDDSEYTYRVTIASAYMGSTGANANVADAPAGMADYWCTYPVGGGFACVFEIGKKENGGGDDDYEVKPGEVRLKYLSTTLDFYNDEIVGDAFQPTINESVVNEDGSISIKNFLGAGFDLKFSVLDKKVQSGLAAGYQKLSIDFPVLTSEGMVLMKNKELTEADPDSDDNYKYNLTTAEGLKLGNDVFAVQPSTGNIYLQTNMSGAQIIEDTPLSKTYRVWLRQGWKLHINKFYGQKGDDGGDLSPVWVTQILYGWSCFDVVVPAVPNVTYKSATGSKMYEPTASIIKQNDDNSYIVDYFVGGEGSISFSIDQDKLVNGNPGLTFLNEGFDNNATNYVSVAGVNYSLKPAPTGTNPNPAVSTGESIMVSPSKSYAKILEAGYNSTKYEVNISIMVGTKIGFAVFEVDGPAISKGEDVTISYANYNNAASVYETVETKVDQVDDNTVVIYNFANSGYNIPFTIGAKVNKGDYEESEIWVAEDYRGTVNGGQTGSFVKLPDGQTFAANIATVAAQNNPTVYAKTWSYVRYYADRVEYHITFGTTVFIAANFTISTGESGLVDVVVDENAPVEWYNLQGVRVNGENLTPGIYVKRQGNKAVKVLVK